jgi:cell division ATPase FtsA
MNKNYEFIIYIGTSTVSLTGVYFDKNNFGRCFYKEYDHGGLTDDFFANPERLFIAIKHLTKACSEAINRTISNCYVILPQMFFQTKVNTDSLAIKDGYVNRFDVNDLMENATQELSGCVKAECVPIAFKVAKGYVDNPIGFLASTLTLISSTIALSNKVQEFFDDTGKRLNIELTLMPLSKPLLNCIQDTYNEPRSSRMVLNFNEDTIDVMYCEMRAVISDKVIEGGINKIKRVLSDEFEIGDSKAEELIDRINLNVNEGFYVISHSELIKIDSKKTNEIFSEALGETLQKVKEAIWEQTDGIPMRIYVTGNKIVSIRGVESFISAALGSAVQVLAPNYLVWNKPEDYVTVGLINMLNKEE